MNRYGVQIARRIAAIAAGTALLVGVAPGISAAPVAPVTDPEFVAGSVYPSGTSSIRIIDECGEADLVVLENGIDEGFLRGAVCIVTRRGAPEPIGEIILVAVEEKLAIGLILRLADGRMMRPTDRVRIKTVSVRS